MAFPGCLEVSTSQSFRIIRKEPTVANPRTSADMAGQMFCTLEAPRTITARVGVPVHVVSLCLLWSRDMLE